MASRRYRTYRGKGPKRLVVGIVCAVLLLAVGYGFVWIFEHLSLNADGTVTVNLPAFMAAPSATPTPKPTELLEIVLVPSEPPPSEESSAPPPDTLAPEPPPTASVMPAAPRAVFVPQTALADAAALESLKAEATAAGANTLVIDYKSDSGDVLTPEAAGAALEALDGFACVARISLFKDNTMPRVHNAWAVRNVDGVHNWVNTDGNGDQRWLNPFSQDAADYCLSVIDAAAAQGFDGILLDNLCFPWYGKIEKITYYENNGDSRAEAIQRFCARLTGMDLQIPVSAVALYDTVANGAQGDAGQNFEALCDCFDALYADWTGRPLEGPPDGVVPILSELPTDWAGGYLLIK